MTKGHSGYSGKSTSFKVAPPPSSNFRPVFSLRKPYSTPPPPPPKPSSTTSSYVPSTTPSTTPSFFGNMMDGFSFGTGASLARNMVDSIFSPNRSHQIQSQSQSHSISSSLPSSCDTLHKTFMECMNKNNNDHYTCSQAFEEYQACTKK